MFASYSPRWCADVCILLFHEKPSTYVFSLPLAMIRWCSQAEDDQAQNVDTEVSAPSTIRGTNSFKGFQEDIREAINANHLRNLLM